MYNFRPTWTSLHVPHLSDIQIRELNGEIRVAGVTEHTVGGREEMLE
jgi:hypothetical protein